MKRIITFIILLFFSVGCQSTNSLEYEFSEIVDKYQNYEQLKAGESTRILSEITSDKPYEYSYTENMINILREIYPYDDLHAISSFSLCIIVLNNGKVAILLYKNEMYFFIKHDGKTWEWRGVRTNGWTVTDTFSQPKP